MGNAIEDSIVEVLRAQLLVKVHYFSSLICSKHVQESVLNSTSETLLEVVDATLESFYKFCTPNLFGLVNLGQQYLNLLDH